MRPTRRPDLSTYLVADPSHCAGRDLVEVVRAAVEGGVAAVQLRAPEADTREMVELGRRLREQLGHRVPLLVNDRVDVALAVDADGVHLGQRDLHPHDARRQLGPDRIVGWSVSTPAQVQEAGDLPTGCVDYLGVGPVWATPTKPGAGAPLGLDGVRELVALASHPCVAIGGIDPANAPDVRATGVGGVAVVSAVCGADDPASSARGLAGA